MKEEDLDALYRPEVIERIAKLISMGFDIKRIKKSLYQEFSINSTDGTIKNIVRQFSIRGSTFLESEKDIANVFKESILNLLEESKKNVSVLSEFRDKIRDMIKLIETKQVLEGENSKKFRMYLNELKDLIRTMDHSISTEKGVLELFDKQKKEIKMSAVQSPQMTMDTLLELEKAGMIVINDELKR